MIDDAPNPEVLCNASNSQNDTNTISYYILIDERSEEEAEGNANNQVNEVRKADQSNITSLAEGSIDNANSSVDAENCADENASDLINEESDRVAVTRSSRVSNLPALCSPYD